MAEYINIHTHKPVGEHVELINAPVMGNWPQGEFFSLGLHPWNIGKGNENVVLENLDLICEKKKVIAIGEIGLDRAIETPIEMQINFFKKQLAIAEKYTLPVIIHNVRATSDLLQLRKENANSTPWIFHGFRGRSHEALQLIDKQCFLSFGEALLNQIKIQDLVKKIPLEYVFFETDDSDKKISSIYEKAAELLDICIPELKDKVYSNFTKIFGEICMRNG